MTELPIFLAERTVFSDELYAVIGRALAFATSFEMNCKALQAVIGIPKMRGLGHETEAIREFCAKLERQQLKKRGDAILKELATGTHPATDDMEFLREWLDRKLTEAREARNEIAHDVTKGIEHCAEHPERRADLIKEVQQLVRRIAEADVRVYDLCQSLTNEPTYGGDYCEDAVKWVCEVE